MKTVFGDVLRQHTRAERITDPANETFVTLRLNGKGAAKRNVGEGKTPQPFSGYRVRAGQFIYSRIDARNGAFAIIPSSLDGAVVSKDFPVFDIDRSVVDPKFLLLSVSNASFMDGIRRLSFGATNRQRVKEEVFLNLPIELPPLEEQRRIAAILDKADELRVKRREALAHLDSLTQSIFHSMFGEWHRANVLSDAISALIGGKNLVGPDDSPNKFRVLKISAVTSGQYLEEEAKPLPAGYEPPPEHLVRRGDVIISRANTTELVGASALVDKTNENTALPDKLWRAVPSSKVVPRYLLAVLQSKESRREISLRSSGSGGSMKNISKPKLLSVPVALPPLELQQTFATRIAAVERLKELHQKHLAELDALFASLQHRAFKGEL